MSSNILWLLKDHWEHERFTYYMKRQDAVRMKDVYERYLLKKNVAIRTWPASKDRGQIWTVEPVGGWDTINKKPTLSV